MGKLRKMLFTLTILMCGTTNIISPLIYGNTLSIETPITYMVGDKLNVDFKSSHKLVSYLDVYARFNNLDYLIKEGVTPNNTIFNENLDLTNILSINDAKSFNIVAKNVEFKHNSFNNKSIPTITVKDSYKVGDIIDYTYSYTDEDGCSIVDVEWLNNLESYDTEGTYTVQLRVLDDCGVWSDWVSKDITISDSYFIDVCKFLVDGSTSTYLNINRLNHPAITPEEVNKLAEVDGATFVGTSSDYSFGLKPTTWGKTFSFYGNWYGGVQFLDSKGTILGKIDVPAYTTPTELFSGKIPNGTVKINIWAGVRSGITVSEIYIED